MAKSIKLHDKFFNLYLSAEKIDEVLDSLAAKINADKIENPIILFALSGAFIPGAHLVVRLEGQWEMAFVKIRSYFDGLCSSGRIVVDMDISKDMEGRNVVIFDDVADTGNSMEALVEMVAAHRPASVHTAVMFLKPDVYKKEAVIDYVGMEIPNDFIVGFGFDYKEVGRNLPDIYSVAPTKSQD